MVVPTRRPDVGLFFTQVFARAHRHDLLPSDGFVFSNWDFCYDGIRLCNQRLQVFSEKDPELAAPFIAEMRVLRALYYYWLVDLFGPVAIITTTESPTDGVQSSRREVFDFIEQEILASLDDLPRTIGGPGYGKINYYTAQALLASLYLNAEVYAGTDRFFDAIEACDAIIASNGYELETDYFFNFSSNNETSTENIFVIPYDEQFLPGFDLVQFTLHPESRWTYNLPFFPLNLVTSTSAFYELFDPEDIRRGSFLTGLQFAASGSILIDSINGPNDPDGLPLQFTPEILYLDSAYVQAGARIAKFEIPMNPASTAMNNDFPIFRYAEVLLNKAEAQWRLDPGNIEAVLIVNAIRARAGLAPLAGLSAELLLNERARELAFEGKRRTDLIRFGQFTAPARLQTPNSTL
jgi:hypothetical protein